MSPGNKTNLLQAIFKKISHERNKMKQKEEELQMKAFLKTVKEIRRDYSDKTALSFIDDKIRRFSKCAICCHEEIMR